MKAKRAFPVMRISMFLIPFTIIALTVFLSSFAVSEDANVILSNKISLRTTATPDHIYSSGIFYDDLSSFIVYSTIINDDMNSLMLDIWNKSGDLIYNKSFCEFSYLSDYLPYVQVYQKDGYIISEYFPAIESMELCYKTTITPSGTIISEDSLIHYDYGAAFYIYNFNQYLVYSQAHAYDTDVSNNERVFKIYDNNSKNEKTIYTTDWTSVITYDIRTETIVLAQNKNDSEVQIELYARDTDSSEVYTIDLQSFAMGESWYVRSAFLDNNILYLLIRKTSETDYLFIAYDTFQSSISASKEITTNLGNDYTSSSMAVNSSLLALIDAKWDEQMQDYLYEPYLRSFSDDSPSNYINTYPCIYCSFLVEKITRLLDIEYKNKGEFALCEYSIRP